MFTHAIHAQQRLDGTFAVLLSGFSLEPFNPPQNITDSWQAMQNDPRVGETYTEVHRFLDNRIVERYQLAHPDEGAQLMEKLRSGEAERAAAAEKQAAVHEMQRALTARGLTVEDLAAAPVKHPSAASPITPSAPPVDTSPATADAPEESGEQSLDPPAAEPRSSRLKKSHAS